MNEKGQKMVKKLDKLRLFLGEIRHKNVNIGVELQYWG
jgi:hypothetical protein